MSLALFMLRAWCLGCCLVVQQLRVPFGLLAVSSFEDILLIFIVFFFFFQAEDGIRDPLVTGVQTCALPILLDSDRSGGTRCELSYVTRGMTWEADYSVIAPAASHGNAARNTGGERSESLDLLGWVTLDNHSGRTFEDARVKLMAGDVHKIQPGQPMTGPVAGLGGGL